MGYTFGQRKGVGGNRSFDDKYTADIIEMEVNLSGMVSGKEVQRPLDDEKEEDDDDDDDVDGSRQRVDGLVFSQLVQLQKLYPPTTTTTHVRVTF